MRFFSKLILWIASHTVMSQKVALIEKGADEKQTNAGNLLVALAMIATMWMKNDKPTLLEGGKINGEY